MLNNLKIATRLTAGFGVVSSLLLVVMIIGLQSLSSLKDGLAAANVTSQHAKVTGDIRNALLNLDIVARKAANEFNETKSAQYLDRMAQIKKDLDTAIETYSKLDATALSSEEIAAFTKIEGESKKLGPHLKVFAERIKSFQNSAAATLFDLDIGPVAEAMNVALTSMADLQKSKLAETDARSASTYSATRIGLLVVSAIAIFVSAILGYLVTQSVTKPLQEAVSVARQVAAGDLTGKLTSTAKDETGQLLMALQNMREQLAAAVGGVRKGADEVKSTSTDLSSTARTLLEGATRQSQSATSTAAALEEIAASVAGVAAAAVELRELSDQSLDATNSGHVKLQQLLGDMTGVQNSVGEIESVVLEFVKSTEAISSMTKQVRDIADQTNLLALNAAIEAARAGEHGRGFAVVADEVRKLAEMSSLSATKIDEVTQSLASQSSAVSQVVERGKASLNASETAVSSVASALEEARAVSERTNRGVSDITSSVNEQKTAITEITRSMEEIAQMADQSRSNVEVTARKASEMERVAVQMESSVKIFKS